MVHIYNPRPQEAELQRFLVRPAWAVWLDPTSQTDKQTPKQAPMQPIKDAADKLHPYHCTWRLTEPMRLSVLTASSCVQSPPTPISLRRVLTKALTLLAAGPRLQHVGWEMWPSSCPVLAGISSLPGSRQFLPSPLPFSLGEGKALESKHLKNQRAGLLE